MIFGLLCDCTWNGFETLEVVKVKIEPQGGFGSDCSGADLIGGTSRSTLDEGCS